MRFSSRLLPLSSTSVPSLCRTSALFLALGLSISNVSVAQTLPAPSETPAVNPAATPSPKNSLGLQFVDIPGIPVMFSTFETRVSDFEKFVKESGYSWSQTPHFPQTGDHPVVNITLPDAIAFCEWLTQADRKAGLINDLQSYRVPTTEEWSAAVGLASGRRDRLTVTQEVEDQRSFPWGIEWPPPAGVANLNAAEINNSDDGYVYTSPVGVFRPSAEGIYDLAGNVWEWTWDQDIRTEIRGLLRGGSWMYFRRESLLSAYEYRVPADLRAPSIGFRCVFEDKHRTAVFLAAAEQVAAKEDQEKRGMLSTGPKVTAEEVEKMKQAMLRKPQTSPAQTSVDISSLTPAKAGTNYTNTLGQILRPLTAQTLIGETEVRVKDYEAYAADAGKPWTRKPAFEYKETHPVMNVTWAEAKQFCDWLTKKERANGLISEKASYRLPTDAEWSIAVGLKDEIGTTPQEKDRNNTTDFPWGTEWPPPSLSANLDTAQMTNYQDNFSYTAPVGSFSPNANHLFDLAGNVSEWCEDLWPGTTDERVIRGSSWLSSKQETLLSSSRQHASETTARAQIGFRVVLTLETP